MARNFTSLEDLFAQIKIACPSCPDTQINFELSKAVRDFFVKTEVWTKRTEIVIDKDTLEYSLGYSDDVYISNLLLAEVFGASVLSSVEILNEDHIGVSQTFADMNDTFVLELNAVVAPLSFPCVIPVHMVNRYFDFFTAGAVMNIAGASRKPYSNPELEAKKERIWQAGLTRASTDSATGGRNKIVGFKG